MLMGMKTERRENGKCRFSSANMLVSLLALVFLAFVFSACTDYVGQIDDQIEDYKAFDEARQESSIPTAEYHVDVSSVFEGTLTDSRDGKVYRTVTIGSSTWMAENLNYETEDSYCYNDIDTNCTMYGRLYKWATAMDSTGKWAENGKGCGKGVLCAPTYPVRGVCPEDWHVPTYGEWRALLSAVGGDYDGYEMLQAKNGWVYKIEQNDDFHFSMTPAGAKLNGGKYFYMANRAYFWMSTDYDKKLASSMEWRCVSPNGSYDMAGPNIDSGTDKDYSLSVRCVKDVTDKKSVESSSGKEPESSSSARSSSLDEEEPSSSEEDPESSSSSSDRSASSSSSSSSSVIWLDVLEDKRDGSSYYVVTIGSLTWMAENLNYKMGGSSCMDDVDSNCVKYGRFYTWQAAMDACPSGWHLPSMEDFDSLFYAVGDRTIAGKILKSKEGWLDNEGVSGGGTDSYGFSALPACGSDSHDGAKSCAKFWSSTEVTEGLDEHFGEVANSVYLYFNSNRVSRSGILKGDMLSVRCVLGEPPSSSSMSSSSTESGVGTSSSEEDESSSSSFESSSSNVGYVEPCKVEVEYEPSKTSMEDNCEYGTLTDERDGQTYGTVKIGTQTWMTENLNYEIESSFCFGGNEGPCTGYGRLYYWSTAMDGAGICPSGWHLPSKDEFEMLIISAGGSSMAGRMLKSTRDWSFGPGIDAYGFNAYPIGGMSDHESYWSSTETGDDNAYVMYFGYEDVTNLIDESKAIGLSVRCVMD